MDVVVLKLSNWESFAALAVCNALSVWLALWLWERHQHPLRRVRQLLWELHCCKLWPGEEPRMRKEALLQELSILGATAVNLENAALEHANLAGVVLKNPNLNSANLAHANLRGAELQRAALFGANLAHAEGSHVDLRGANLRGANLRNANLIKADLRNANLHRAVLIGANLEGAKLEGARLHLANFADVQTGVFEQIHPSIEDWIRADLDDCGRYQLKKKPSNKPPRAI